MLDVDEDENSSTMLVALWESPEGAADDMLDEREKVEEVEEVDVASLEGASDSDVALEGIESLVPTVSEALLSEPSVSSSESTA